MLNSNQLAVVMYNFLLTISTTLFSISVWYMLGLFLTTDKSYYILQHALYAVGGLVGSWVFAVLTRSKGLKASFMSGSILSALSYVVILFSLHTNSLQLFMLTRFLNGMFESTDAVLTTDSILFSNNTNRKRLIHYRDALYASIALIVWLVTERLLGIAGETIIFKLFPLALALSVMTAVCSIYYENVPGWINKAWSWSIPLKLTDLRTLLPMLLSEITSTVTEIMLPLMIVKVMYQASVAHALSRIFLIIEVSAISYSLVFARFKGDRLSANIRGGISGILLLLLFMFNSHPWLIYLFGLSGLAYAAFECSTIERIGDQYTSDEVPYMSSALASLNLIAKLFGVLMLSKMNLDSCIYVIALMHTLILLNVIYSNYNNYSIKI
jgi:uncharacterized membrane protein YsdA (DUF1294 family)